MRRPTRHVLLVCAALVVAALCLRGITSPVTHPDQMALMPLFKPGLAPFNPGWFEKPPFHTYTNYFLSVWPSSVVADALHLTAGSRATLTLVWSRSLSSLMLLATAGLLFTIVRRTFSAATATVLAVLVASSAGLIAHVHFLTADVPVMTWMLAAYFFGHRAMLDGRLANYLLAGLLTGVATATKYNALAVGLVLPVAHWLREYWLEAKPLRLAEFVAPWKLVAGVACVVVGFVLANPFAVLDHRTFVYDFVHNYRVAPVYEGQTGSSYGRFFGALGELVGLPGLALLVPGVLASWLLSLRPDVTRVQKASIWLATSVLALYYLKFAPFPRLEPRFVIPIVPIAALSAALAIEHAWRVRSRAVAALAIAGMTVAYNVACAYVVTGRFDEDPRPLAAEWLGDHVPAGSVIEMDVYAPSLPASARGIEVVPMPFVSGRERLFERLFPGDPFVVGPPEYYRRVDEMTNWYSPGALHARRPDFVVIDRLYYGRFIEPGPRRDLYPTMGPFFSDLLAEQLGYAIVFDRSSAPVPHWVYPKRLDFQDNRITVLARSGAGH